MPKPIINRKVCKQQRGHYAPFDPVCCTKRCANTRIYIFRDYLRQILQSGPSPANALSLFWYDLSFAKFPGANRIMLHPPMSKSFRPAIYSAAWNKGWGIWGGYLVASWVGPNDLCTSLLLMLFQGVFIIQPFIDSILYLIDIPRRAKWFALRYFRPPPVCPTNIDLQMLFQP